MVTEEFKKKIDNDIAESVNSYLKYNEKLNDFNIEEIKSFKTKSKQKEILDYVSRAFEELSNADQYALIIPMNQANENNQTELCSKLSNIYYNYADYPHTFTEKKQALIKEYCPHFDELLRLRNLWLSIKNLPIEPRQTKEEKTTEKKENLLKTVDYSNITDMEKWNNSINELINEVDELITPFYEQLVADEKLDEKTMLLFKKWELLDVRFTISKTLNFDINEFQLLNYSDCYKCWKINNNLLLKIETILAGGYNIQRLHNRTIVKIKKI